MSDHLLKTIEFVESIEIEDYEEIATDFLKDICNLDYAECFVSDLSTLSDFAGCCLRDDIDISNLSYPEYVKISRADMVEKIHNHYGIEVIIHEKLIDVFCKIRMKKSKLNH